MQLPAAGRKRQSRELRLVKILRSLEDRVGDSVDGIVTGVTNFGLYVQLSKYLVDGLVRFEELADDWWEVDADRGCVNAERSGRRISIGQELEVTISQVDVAARQLNLRCPNSSGSNVVQAVASAKAVDACRINGKRPRSQAAGEAGRKENQCPSI
ncbi:MAG: S1 RNA-binding domain-containing protein [Phycisphaerae bacterium]